VKKGSLLELSALAGIGAGSFLGFAMLVGTVIFSLFVPFHEAIHHFSGYEPTNLEMLIAVVIVAGLTIPAFSLISIIYMLTMLVSLWYLTIIVDTVIWLAPALASTMLLCPLLIFQTLVLFGKKNF
jgi:hypothetical protein